MIKHSQENRWDPSYYSENSSTQLKHAQELIYQHIFSGSENILDIGCGDGKITSALSRLVPHGKILGIDKSEKMVRFAKDKYKPQEFPNLNFDALIAQNIDHTNQFDLIVSFSCLHFIKTDEQLQVLKNVKRALKPDGKLTFMLYRKCPTQWSAINIVAGSDRWTRYFEDFIPDFHEYLPEHYQALLDQAGLGHFRASFTPVENIIYANQEMVSRFIKGWLPHVLILPQDMQDEFVNEVTAQYLRNLGAQRDGPIKIPFVRLVVT